MSSFEKWIPSPWVYHTAHVKMILTFLRFITNLHTFRAVPLGRWGHHFDITKVRQYYD